MSAPGQEKETNSWHLLCTTKLQTARKERQVDVTVNPDIHMHLKKKNSFIFIFSSLLDKRPLFEIYFWPCSINSRYMLQLPVLRHCFSSYNSHDLLLVLDIAQALAHLWANIDGFTFSYQTSEYQQISTSLSIPEIHCRNGLWRIMPASKAPKITNFKVHNHFFKTVLPFLSFSLILQVIFLLNQK